MWGVASDRPPAETDDQRAMRLLLALREHGFGAESVKVGDVELVGVTDHIPHPKALVSRAGAEDRDRQPGRTSYIDEFGGDLVERDAKA